MLKKQYANNTNLIKKHSYFKRNVWLSVLLSISFFSITNAQTLSSLTLADALDAAIAQQHKMVIQQQTNDFKLNKSSSWLASSPSIAMSYLKSDLQQGTDELEMSLNLPIKSSLQSNIDQSLVDSNKTLSRLFTSNLRLQLSAVLREQLWNIEIAQIKRETLQQKVQFLKQLEQQYQQLFQSTLVTKYPLLLIKQETLTTKIELLSSQQALNTYLLQYESLTGLTTLPRNINEQLDEINISVLLAQHPLLMKLDQTWIEQQQRLKLASNKAQPWNLSLTAKNLNNSIYQETQLGISAEVALTIFDTETQSLNNEWLEARGQYDLEKTRLYIELEQNLQSILNQQNTLTQKQALLEQSKTLSKEIIKETQLLINANQIDQNQAIRRMLAAFNTKAQYKLNQLLLRQNTAMLKQAAGISL
jgi:outer membrane protein TolC